MTRYALYFALFLLLGTATGCGVEEQVACGPDNCTGCCQGNMCVAGNTDQVCGSHGLRCDVCSNTQQCVQGDCVARAGTGGGSGGSGGAGGGGTGGSGGSGGAGGTGGTGGTGGSGGTGGTGGSGGSGGAGGGGSVCVAESNALFCARNFKVCGALTGVDNCGNARSVTTCGSCSSPNTCTNGACVCTPETNAQLCTRLGKACGAVTSTDNCGATRTITSCGTCASGNACNAGVCACAAESNASFCSRLGAVCGAVSGTDTCGNPRSVANCGSCFGSQTCGGGGQPNTCGCTAQTDVEFCASKNADCGSVTGYDNCSTWRTATCGVCTSPETCGGGGTANVCACAPESNAAFCSRLGKNCGSVTAADNCGVSRTTTCGSTCSGTQTCGGGGTPNVCGCTGETDAAFCARLGKNCGQTTGTDNCGVTRTAASCGTCSGWTSCHGGGVLNVCGGRQEPMQKVCGGGYCWENPTPVGTTLHAAATAPSGNNWVAGEAGTVLQWNGSTWRGWFALANVRLNAVWAFSDTDVWAAGGGGTVLHFDGTAWSPVTSGTTSELRGLWGASDGTLWAVGDGGIVLRRASGGSFVAQTVPTTNRLNAVFGVGGDVWVAGTGVILRYTGTAWSSTASSWDMTGIWGASSTDVWAASNYGVMRFTGTQWATSTSAQGDHVYGRAANDVWVLSGTRSGYHFDGLAWSSAIVDNASGYYLGLNAITGGAGGTMLAVGESGLLYRYDQGRWWLQTRGTRTPSSYATMQGLTVAGGNAIATGYLNTVSSGYGYALHATGGGVSSGSGVSSYGFSAPAAAAANNVWTVDSRRAWRYDGSAWAPFSLPANSPTARAVAPLATNDAWIVGGDRTWRFDGTNWTAVPNPISSTSVTLRAVSAAGPSHVWAAGSAGTLLFFNGSSWSSVTSGVTTDITRLRSAGTSNTLATGSFGVIKWNGTTWAPTARTTAVGSAWPESATTFWLTGTSEVKRWDGAQFVDMAPWLTGTSLQFVDVAGEAGTVWLLGSGGELLKR